MTTYDGDGVKWGKCILCGVKKEGILNKSLIHKPDSEAN